MDLEETRNGNIETDEDYTNIHFIVGDRREIASFRPDQVTNKELKELFRSAAEAGPQDIVKLRKGDKLLNITAQLSANTIDTPYVLQIVGAHLPTSGMIEADLLRELERRISSLEREIRQQQDAISSEPSLALRELKDQMDAFRTKLETTEHLSWLGFHKKLPSPVSSEACRRLQYRRKSDSVKRQVREEFLKICDISLSLSVNKWLRSPAFDAGQWKDEELLLMLQTMFIELELPQKFDIPFPILRNFLYEVYNNYNAVPFHNFRHCFCVAQMMYAIAWAVDLPNKIGHLEVLVLIVSCICHDLDHPGYNNIYQINARTELALRYNDISPLENHHCSVAFRVLESPECNILASLDSTTYRTVREGIIRCILATDMARHNEILGQFNDTISEFDYSNKSHINLLSMVLIKVADISNEARPMEVAEPWLDQLLQEFFKQSDAEKLEGLPVTPFMDRDKVTKPSSQCSFIGLVLLPLFESLGELLTELDDLIVQPVRDALEYYRRLNEAAKDERHHRKSIVDVGESTLSTMPINTNTNTTLSSSSIVIKSTSSQSMKSKRSICSTLRSRSRSRSIEDDNDNQLIEDDAENDNESSDPETATEVEISEKTLKFKISTEGNIATTSAGRKSYPGSRKGSREKSSFDYYHNNDLVKAIKDHERERKKSRGEIISSDMSSPVSARSGDDTRIIEEYEKDDNDTNENGINTEIINNNNTNKSPKKKTTTTTSTTKITEKTTMTTTFNDNDGDDDKIIRKDIIVINDCCCCDDKTTVNNHKSLLSRLRNFTDRLSISFDSKESPLTKTSKNQQQQFGKCLTKSNSVMTSCTSQSTTTTMPSPKQNNLLVLCKRCNLVKTNNINKKDSQIVTQFDKRAMTLPKTKKSHDGKNKSWRMVFTKDKRPSSSLELFPSSNDIVDTQTIKHKRNLSNPEGKITINKSQSLKLTKEQQKILNFHEIDIRKKLKPEIIVLPGSSNLLDENIEKVEIRRSSASMEDISKITKQNENLLLGTLENKTIDDLQHTGSLDSMLYNDSTKIIKKPFGFSSPSSTKKSTTGGIFSRFKSGMSIDGTRTPSNSGSLHDQPSQSGWISSLTASFRPKRHTNELPSSPGHEEVK